MGQLLDYLSFNSIERILLPLNLGGNVFGVTVPFNSIERIQRGKETPNTSGTPKLSIPLNGF